MAEDWDLYAVVRRCTSAANSSRATESNDDSRNENRSSSSSFREDPLACLASLTFEEEDDPFRFPNISQQNGSLQDSYKPFLPNVANPTTTTTNQGVEPCSSSSLPGGSSGRQLHHHQRLQPPEQPTTTASIEIGSPLTPTSAPIFDFSGFTNQQQQSQSPPLIDRLNLPQKQLQQRVQPQVPRSRKRKNQQKRTVCHVTADNLSSDPWAWRKYGQKPIKGSPYPRNYYRCSGTKGCLARKQVERSHLDPNIFIITYTGEHTHPKPTHRNSLAGSTRNKVSTVQKGATTTKDSAVDTNPTASCSSPRSTACLSPISPTTTLSVPEDAVATVHNSEGEEDSIDMAGESDDDDYLLIPNVHVDEDLFKGLEELVGSGGVERSPTFGDNFSSWSPGNSRAAGAAASDGC